MSVLTISQPGQDRTFGTHYAPRIHPQSSQQQGFVGFSQPSYPKTWPNQSLPAPANTRDHRHSRNPSYASTTSLPPNPYATKPSTTMLTQRASHVPSTHSRQPSVGTVNSIQQEPDITALPRRSTSSRSTGTNSPTSYVALMRKQKATVWCDRSQNIDPRTAAAQKAAKQRANLEVIGVNYSGRPTTISSGSMVGKIRHGGIPKAGTYVPPNMSGAGVPMRLSANEMLGDDEQERTSLGDNSMMHARTGSGKSSTNSAKYRSGYPRVSNSPPDAGSPAREGIPEASETPGVEESRQNYFEQRKPDRSESEDSFGELKEMSAPSAAHRAIEKSENADDLRRRGSVDERTMSMGAGVRLFVANPDLDDD